ncbi:twitching motility protein PilT [Planctomycetales bacterium]|nr:twitching motility protein PilT [Planctomycetales bacterium]GHT02633.1 twitching motility protein PilT [Planctomycetales bacterium]
MKILIDASVLMAVIINEPPKARVIELTKGAEILSPAMLPYEIGNALSRLCKRRILTAAEAIKGFQIYRAISLRLLDVNFEKALAIAGQFAIYAYDAYYLEIATRLRLPLLTFDERIEKRR